MAESVKSISSSLRPFCSRTFGTCDQGHPYIAQIYAYGDWLAGGDIEVLDKITILEIKSERMDDPEKVANVRVELALLQETWNRAVAEDDPAVRSGLLKVEVKEWYVPMYAVQPAGTDE